MDLALPVAGGPGGDLIQHACGEALGGVPRFCQGRVPRALKLQHLGAVDQAQAVVGDHLGLAVAPPRQRVRPLAGVAQLECVATEGDRVAEDDAGDHRGELAIARHHEGLVDQSQRRVGPCLPEQGPALLVVREPDQVGVPESLADLGGLDRGRVARLVVTTGHLLEPARDQEPAALDAVAPVALQLPLRTREPSPGAHRLAPEHHVVPDPEPAAHRARHVAGARVRVMGALEGGDVGIVVTEHVFRASEQLEVVRIQLDLRVRGGKPLTGVEPRALGVRLAAALQVGDGRRHALDYRQRWRSCHGRVAPVKPS